MKVTNLGSLSSVTTASVVTTGVTPNIQGRTGVIILRSPAGDFAGAAKVQGSDDNTTYSDISGASVSNAGVVMVTATIPKYLRLNCTARTAGTVTADILGD